MKTVYKYRLPLEGESCTVQIPKGANPLHVNVQGRDFFLWALVDTDVVEKENCTLFVLGTGHEMPEKFRSCFVYLNTFLVQDGAFVFHAFMVSLA